MIFGVPETLMTDNGPQFISKEFNKLLTSFDIHHQYTAVYSPQANASERVNRSILAAIRSYLHQDHRKWDTYVGEIGCALRSTVHSATEHSPYYLNFGSHMATHGSVYKLLKRLDALASGDVDVPIRSDQLRLVHEQVQHQLELAHRKYEARYNLRSRKRSFSVGQEVYRRNFALSNAAENFNTKLADRFLKCRIARKIGSSIYLVEDEHGKPIGKFHAKDLRT